MTSGQRATERDDRRILTRSWEETLGVPVGPDDDFFALGGDSVRAATVVARVQRELGVQLSLGDFFAAPTVAGMHSLLAAGRGRLAAARAPSGRGYVTIPSVRQAEMLAAMHRSPQLGRHRPMPLLLRVPGRLEADLLAARLAGLSRRHDVLRSRFVRAAGEWRVEVADAAAHTVPVDVVDVTTVGSEAVDEDAVRRSFAMPERELDAPLRTVHYRCPDGDAVLLVANHLVFDGVSAAAFVAELMTSASEDGIAAVAQYYYFSAEQRTALTDGGLAASVDYWVHQSERYELWPEVSLPGLTAGEPGAAVAAGFTSAPLSDLELGRFRQACRGLRVPVYSGLLAAGCLALGRVGGPQGDRFGVNVVSAGRGWPGTTDMIGLFATYLTVGLGRLPRDFGEAAVLVHGALIEALRHEVVPRAEILRRCSEPLFPEHPCLLFDRVTRPGTWLPVGAGSLADVRMVQPSRRTRKYPGLFLMAVDRPEGLDLGCEYSPRDCPEATVTAVVRAWRDVAVEAGSSRAGRA